MGRYSFIILRPFQLIPVLIGISIVTFMLMQAVPGDPIRAMLGEKASEEVVAALRDRYGLDQPIFTQYFYYMKNLLTGDLGQSFVYKVPVVDLLGRRIQATLFLVAYSTVLAILITLPLATLSALYKGRWVDLLIRALSTVGLGFPSFWLGIMLIITLSVWNRFFPVSGYGEGFLGHIYYLFLPSFTIAIGLSAVLIRTMRANLLETMSADYVTAANARGLTGRHVFIKHVLPNSLIPAVNLLGVTIGWLLGGTVVVETVFSVPGLGQLLVQSIFARDYFVIQSLTLCFAVAAMVVTFAVDVITLTLDPRVEF